MVTRVGSVPSPSLRSRLVRTAALAVAIACAWGLPLSAQQGTPLRKIGELELAIRGLTATVEPRLTVPKNIASGVRIDVRAGAATATAADAVRLLGGEFRLKGELSGPGLTQTQSLPDGPSDVDPFLLRLPGLTRAGHYALANLRLVRGEGDQERTVLDVVPNVVDIEVIDEVLLTSVTTRPLTLDEIKQKGIVLDKDDYLGFEFTLAMKLESTPVNISFPVVFDRQGVAKPEYLRPPDVSRSGVVLPTIVPVLLEATTPGGTPGSNVPLTLDGGQEVRIPSVIVIPGNVGYLKQFFSAQLFVANGAPAGAHLTVRNIQGTINLPAGQDTVVGTSDDPLALAETAAGPPSKTLAVRGLGLDGQANTGDDRDELGPGEQGQAEFLVRGNLEGFHAIGFDIQADLEGLPIGPVTVKGKASGGVLVRNPYFDITFTAPAVVREGEPFSLFATVTNIGQGPANDLNVVLDSLRMSGARVADDGAEHINTLAAGDAETLEFTFVAERTGEVVASYLKFDTQSGASGDLRFTLGVGERGVPLSPDTLVLPAVVDRLPQPLVKAALRVLGQAWSVANAPGGTLRAGVVRPTKDQVFAKALALAEAGLRIELGQPSADALGDLATDWYVGATTANPRAPIDPGLDQILRETNAGQALARAFGTALAPGVAVAGGAVGYESARANVAISGPDFVSFVVAGATGDITLTDAAGRRSTVSRTAALGVNAVPGAAFIPLGEQPDAPILGLISRSLSGLYTIGVASTTQVSVATTAPRGDGRFAHASTTFEPGSGAFRGALEIDLSRPDRLAKALDSDADGTDDHQEVVTAATLSSPGPRVVSAHIVGPETLDSAGPFGLNAFLLFDRVVDPTRAAIASTYTIPNNAVVASQAVLSGRFVALSLAQPEGPYVPTTIAVAGLPDARGVVGPATPAGGVPLVSRLTDPGAVVSGRVQRADGTPIGNGSVVYGNNTDTTTCFPQFGNTGLSRIALDAAGHYEFRYIRQDPCGIGFSLFTTDPDTGARTEQSRVVRSAGERIVVDFTHIARGSVTGIVRQGGVPVGGARVVAVSELNPQVGGSATTDGDGRYLISGLLVGQVNVRAVYGNGAGRATGTLFRGGTTATVDVLLDGGTVNVHGAVTTRRNGADVPLRNALVAYYVSSDRGLIPVGYALTNDVGSYGLTAMPSGTFQVVATYDQYSASASGTAAAGDDRTVDLVFQIPQTRTLTGIVQMPDNTAARDVLVSVAGRGRLTDQNGAFTIADVPTGTQTVIATTRDELRQGTTVVRIPETGDVPIVTVKLSGLGRARFTVVGPDGQPVRNAQVVLLNGRCSDPCGCSTRVTGPDGTVEFPDVNLGRAEAKAIVQTAAGYDSALGTTTITRDGEVATGTIQLLGFGTVTGTVFDADHQAAHGADIVVSALHFVNDGVFQCGMVAGPAHRVRTDVNGTFRVPNVAVGPITVTATHPFAPTPATKRDTIARAGQTVDVRLDLSNTTAGELSGIVRVPDGVTPAGAGVEVTVSGLLPDVTVRTDANGVFRFARIFPEGRYNLTARDPVSGGVAQNQIYLRTAQDLTADVRLRGRGRLTVRVEDAAGNPIQTARVQVQENAYPSRHFERWIEESSAGRVAFENLYEGAVSVEASDPFGRDGVRVSAEIPADAADVSVTLRLGPIGTVTGRLLRPIEGGATEPVPFGTISLLVNTRVIGQTTTLDGDHRGEFTFDHVPAGAFTLQASDPATGRSGRQTGVLAGEGQTVAADVRLVALGTVQGTVTQNGQPRSGATVEIASTGFFHVFATTDENGHYVMPGVPEGLVTARASLGVGGELAGTNEDTLAGEGTTLTVNVALRGSAPVTGRLLTYNAQPAPLSIIRVTASGLGGGIQTTTTDSGGYFHFYRVPEGPTKFEATVSGSEDRAVRMDVPIVAGDAPVVVDLQLHGVGTLQGVARDASGNPVSGLLTVESIGGDPAFSFRTGVSVPASGAFAWPELLANNVQLTLTSSIGGFQRTGIVPAQVIAGQVTTRDAVLEDSGTVTFRVLRAGGVTPAASAQARIELADRRVATFTAGVDGVVTAVGVPLRTFSVQVTHPLSGGVAFVPSASMGANGQIVDLGTVTLDDRPFAIESTDPADGATGVSTSATVSVRFTYPLQPLSIGSIQLFDGTTPLFNQPVLATDGRGVTFSGGLPSGRAVTIVVPATILDIFGRELGQTRQVTFQTITEADVTAPFVRGFFPATGALQVPVDSYVEVEYSEPVAAAGIANGVYIYGNDGLPVPATTTVNGRFVRIVPSAPLAPNVRYGISARDVRDLNGNLQLFPRFSNFATPDTVAPVLTLREPIGGATYVFRPQIRVGFEDAVAGVIASPATVTLRLDGVDVVPSYGVNEIAFTPSTDLAEGTHTIHATVADRAGNVAALDSTFELSATAPSLRITYRQRDGQPGVGAGVSLIVNGSPVPGGVTDAAGQVLIPAAPTGALTVEVIDADANHRGTVHAPITLTSADFGVERQLEVLQAPAGTVIVRAYAVGHTPYAGARVQAFFDGDHCIECGPQTGIDGTFTITHASPNDGHGTITVVGLNGSATVTASADFDLVNEGDVVTLDLELPVSVLRGTTRFTDGASAGAVQAFAEWTDPLYGPQQWFANQNVTPGAFSFFGLPAGPVTLVVQDQETGLAGTASTTLVDTSVPLNVPVVLEASGTVVGTVRDYAGGVPTDALVSVTPSHGVARSAVVDAAGHYRLEHAGLGPVVVDAAAYGQQIRGQATGSLDTDNGTATIDVTLPPSAVVTGVVRDGTGAPIADTPVEIDSDTGVAVFAITDAVGVYRNDHVPIGNFSVYVARGYLNATVSGTLTTNGEIVTRDVTLPLGATVAVSARGSDGAIAEGAYVTVSSPTVYIPGAADATGAFTAVDLPAGEYTATVFVGAFGAYGTASTTVAAGETGSVVVTVPSATVTGQLLDGATDAPLAGFNGYLAFDWFGSSVHTDGDGRIALAWVPAGTHTIAVSGCLDAGCSVSASGSTTVTVTAGVPGTFTLRLNH